MYTNVKVTNICSDGTLYCQVPCKGLNKLNDLLHKTEDYFHCKVWRGIVPLELVLKLQIKVVTNF